MKILVTGGYGQVGSTVTNMFLSRGDEVLSIDDFATGRHDNLSPHNNLRSVKGSIKSQGGETPPFSTRRERFLSDQIKGLVQE